MKFLLIILALALFPFSGAHAGQCQGANYPSPAGTPLICSYTVYGHGTCNGQDQVVFQQGPWEQSAITIRGLEFSFFQSPPNLYYAFAGNSYVPDVMLMIGPNERSGRFWYPAGTGSQFPPIGTAATPHLDLHVACAAGNGDYQVFYIVKYSVP